MLENYLTCLICGTLKQASLIYELETSVCYVCCDRIANIYNKHHSGRYLTWQDDEPKKERRPDLTAKRRWEIFKRDNYRCQKCNSPLDLTVDHKTPPSKGGTNDQTNLITLCRPCNSRKGNKVAA